MQIYLNVECYFSLYLVNPRVESSDTFPPKARLARYIVKPYDQIGRTLVYVRSSQIGVFGEDAHPHGSELYQRTDCFVLQLKPGY